MAYLKIFRDLPDPEEALRKPKDVKLPENDRPDVMYALCAAVAVRVVKKTFANMLVLVDRIGPEYAVMAVKTAITRKPELKTTKEFTDWITKNARYIDG